jgi:hypothetical protein
MRKISLVFLIASAVSGCAPQPQKPMPRIETPTQTCNSERECAAMWSFVPELLEQSTRMRIATVSDIYVATYPPIDARFLGGVATKSPVSADTTEIKVAIECHRYMRADSCQRLTILATNLFNAGMKMKKTQYDRP